MTLRVPQRGMLAVLKQRSKNTPYVPKSDLLVYALLVVVSIAVRIRFLGNFDMVSFDGTYYINQAKALWTSAPQPGAFPIGYPFFISLFLPLVGDGVRAAQVVSFLASLGSLIVFFQLAKRFLDRHLAFYCSLFLAFTPLFIRLSLATFSESTYLFWMLLTLLLYARGKDASTGFAGGVAAITRPEMLAVVGLLSLMRAKTPRRALILIATFVAVYSANTLKFYQSTGNLTILPKSEFFGVLAQGWQEREKTADGGPETLASSDVADQGRASAGQIITTYFAKLPREIYTLGRNVLFIPLLLAVFGMYKKRSFLMVSFVPFLIGPLFTVRIIDRYLLAYVPIVILYAFVGANAVKKDRPRQVVLAALVLAACLGPVVNNHHLSQPVDGCSQAVKSAGLFLKTQVADGDKLADRKPYVAFYSGAKYVEVPHDAYEKTIQYLIGNDVRFLALNYSTMDLRPMLAPLLTHRPAIVGELRLTQIYGSPEGMLIYELTEEEHSLGWTRITHPQAGRDTSPSWSPDGTSIVFSSDRRGDSDIYTVNLGDKGRARVLVDGPGVDVYPDWSPDGTRIAFGSNRNGAWDIFTADVASGNLRQITNDPSTERTPRWTPNGKQIVFSSNRTGNFELWKFDLADGSMTQLTNGGNNNHPSLSPDGTRIAYTRRGQELVILDLKSGSQITAVSPRDVNYSPAWSPDGRYLAVTAMDWGSIDIYLVTADGQRSVLLTKNFTRTGERAFDALPSWSPDGRRLAIVSSVDGRRSLYVVEGLAPFIARMENPPQVFVFEDKDG